MSLVYRGLSYDHQPSAGSIANALQSIERESFDLIYRGVSYQCKIFSKEITQRASLNRASVVSLSKLVYRGAAYQIPVWQMSRFAVKFVRLQKPIEQVN